MTSTDTASTAVVDVAADDNVKTVSESGYDAAAPPPRSEYYGGIVQFVLRLLLLACSITALLLLVTNKQTKLVPVSIRGFPQTFIISRDAKFQNSPALIYLLVALSVTALYSIITLSRLHICHLKAFSLYQDPVPSSYLRCAGGRSDGFGHRRCSVSSIRRPERELSCQLEQDLQHLWQVLQVHRHLGIHLPRGIRRPRLSFGALPLPS